jgi:Na+:H+ antiporter, NhaA family
VRTAVHEVWRGVHQTLRNDVVAGALVVGATVVAVVLANSPAVDVYAAVRDYTVGPAALHLDLSVQEWAADGLLAVFFFVVGLELKEEFVAGRLRNPRSAAVPIAAALGGVVTPAFVFVAINATAGVDALRGWAIPAATDIAFAVAVLAVVGRFLPPALRFFLLTLAIVDDLVAITIIATAYTDDLALIPLALAVLPLAGFAVLVQRGIQAWWLLVPLAAVTWALVHDSGVHPPWPGCCWVSRSRFIRCRVPASKSEPRTANRSMRASPRTSRTDGPPCPARSPSRSSRCSPLASRSAA